MRKFILVLVLSLTSVSGQNQFLRQVVNPKGPSQIVIRGGFLGNSASPDEVEIVPEEQGKQEQPVQLSDSPQQALPLQATLDAQPIPEGEADNPFTNGNSGFGLRLSQQVPAPARPSQQRQQVAPQPVQQSVPAVTQQQQLVQHLPVQQQLVQPLPVQQQLVQHLPVQQQLLYSSPVQQQLVYTSPVQQQILQLPQLSPGQQYVDVYGKQIVFTQPQVSQPQPTVPTTTTTTPKPIPVQKQAFVDQYGKVLGEIAIQQQVIPVGKQVIQSAPVVQNVIQPAALEVPIVENVIQPATLEVPLLKKAPPSLTIQTYAIPAVRKVGDRLIPYAQKVQVVKPLVDGVVISSPLEALALVKSKHKTVLSPKVAAPVAVNEIHAAHPVVQQVQTEVHAPAQVLVQEQQQHVVVEQPHVQVAQVPQQLVQVQHQVPVAPQQLVQVQHQVPVAQVPQQLVQVQHQVPQQLVQVQHQVPGASQQLVQVQHQVPVAHAPQQLVQVQHQVPQQLVQVQHQVPQQLVQVQHQVPQQLVQVQHQVPVASQQLVQVQHQIPVAHAPQQLVQVEHQVPVAQPQLEVVHHAPQQVVLEQQHHVVQTPHVVETHHAPVVVEKVKHIAEVPVVPEFTLIHQPVLPKALFQKHIFNVKHGSEPLIYQDLCTVYPYQKNLRACVLKKAVLPELHHPDIRTVNVEYAPPPTQQTDQTIIAGGSAIVSPVPAATPQPQAPSPPTVTISKNPPKNIQDTIKRESKAAKAAAVAKEAAASSQPEAAETRDTNSSRRTSRRRRKNSSTKIDNDGFKLV